MKEGLQVGLTTMATTEDHRKDPYEGKSGGGASGKTQITQSGVEAIKETIKSRARTLLLNMQVGMNVPEKKRMGITTLAMNNPSLHRQIMEQAEQEQVAEAKEAAKAAATAAERADLEKEFAAKTEVLRAAREKARVAEAAAKEAGNDGTDAGEFDEDGDEGGNLTWDEFQRVRGKKYEYAQDLSHLRWKASVTTDQWRAHNAEARKQRAERSISEVESALLEALPAEKVARAGRRMAVKRAFPVFNTQHVEEAADARRGERRSGVLGSDELRLNHGHQDARRSSPGRLGGGGGGSARRRGTHARGTRGEPHMDGVRAGVCGEDRSVADSAKEAPGGETGGRVKWVFEGPFGGVPCGPGDPRPPDETRCDAQDRLWHPGAGTVRAL